MRIKAPREKRILYFKTALRWILYYVVIILSFMIMTSGTWLKPVLLVPVALCVTINNNKLASAFTGAFCGLLIDISCGRLFGYNAVLLTVFCVAVSLAFELYFRNKLMNFIWMSAAVAFLQGLLDFEFYFNIWQYPDVDVIFREYTLKVWAYTVISSLFVWLVIKLINHFLMPKEHLTIKEIIDKRTSEMPDRAIKKC